MKHKMPQPAVMSWKLQIWAVTQVHTSFGAHPYEASQMQAKPQN